MNLCTYLNERALRNPEYLAFMEDDVKLTFQQLEAQSQHIAQGLRELGVGPGSRVALLLPNGLIYAQATFGIWRLGAQVVLVNPQLTGPELKYILEDSAAQVAIIQGSILEQVQSQREHLPCLTTVISIEPVQGADHLWANLLNTPICAQIPIAPVTTQDIAAVLYTSGTTGRPKGALLSHGNLEANSRSGIQVMQVTEQDRFFCILPMFHAFAFTCALVIPVRSGASAVLAAKFAPRQLALQLTDPALTLVLAVPSLLGTLLKFPAPFRLGSGVRAVLCGGAALSPDLEAAFRSRFGVTVLQGYGATECSPLAAYNPPDGVQKPGSIGLPMPEGHELAIAEPDGEELLGTGQIGELVVRGPHVFLGYLNQPEATAKTFTATGWLRTGDLAYRDQDGYYFVVDRIKDMINVAGEKVFSPEVEAILQAYPGIQESAVVGAPDPGKGEIVWAYVTLTERQPSAQAKAQLIDQLIQHCRTQLATFKVPKHIEILEDFPRSGVGKILKRVLRQQLVTG
ncbi:AMP-binding protein [Anthocerotibacter panamensis]|uniref:AMP-binding protein n=1 Tax=Anthocerotibacter panamensis TaxID=2857077 RepID=UPI001C406DA3|nr:AMP-binding protein [Anthocerotibacter panamensis]